MKHVFLILFLTLCFIFSFQSEKISAENRVNFQHISLKEGLSQSTVYDIKQDQLGYIWVATADGLNRYDGYKFVVFRHNPKDSLSLPSNMTNSLLLDKNGDLWIGTGLGLARYNHNLNSFTTFGLSNNGLRMRVLCLEKWNDDEFFVATNLGLFIFSAKNGFKVLNFPPMSFGKTAMLKIDDKKILIGADRGLYFYYPKTNNFTLANIEFNGKSIMSMLPEDNDRKKIWIGTEGSGLYLYDLQNNQLKKYYHDKNNSKSISSNFIRSLCYDSQHRLWIGTFVGLNILNEVSGDFTRFYNNYQDDGSISQNSIRSIFSDSQGGLWLGTYYGGLNYYHPLKTQFEHIYYIRGANSLNDNVVSSMLAEPDGKIWIGTNDKGLDLYNTKTNDFVHFKNEENNPRSLSGNNIKALLKLDNGNLLVGTHGGGLNYFETRLGKFSRINLSQDPMINDYVYELVKDKIGNVWIGTLNGLMKYSISEKKVIPFVQIAPISKSMNPKIMGLFIDSKERLWIGTDNGVWIYSISTGKSEQINFAEKTRTEKTVYCFFEHSSGRIWVGTSEGVFYFENNKLISYSEKKGFPDYHICSFQEDLFKRLWIGTNRGLICLSTDSEKWRIYSESDGIQSNQFNDYSSCKTIDDKMLFGGINGITIFSPEHLIDNPYSPSPIIDQLTVFNKIVTPNDNTSILSQNIEHTKSVKLKQKYSVFGLEFVVPNFLSGKKNTFKYILEGFDKEWYTTEKNSVSYSNLSPGIYTFRVKAANNNGKWSLDETRLEIEVLPYWYNTWWAKILFLGLLIIVSVSLIRFYLSRKFISKELELERVNNERVKEIDQAKIRFFVNVSHEFRTPLTLILSPVREMLDRGVKESWVKHQLDLIERNAERMLHLVNQALDYRKTELGAMPLYVRELEIEPLVKTSFDLFIQLAKKNDFEYNFHSNVGIQKVFIDTNYLERILSNLLGNAFKYTPKGGKITLNLSIKDNFTCIEVEDTGTGISKDKFQKIFDRFYQEDDNTQGTGIGLSLVKNLVEKHHGQITLESELGNGSKFKVLLPAERTKYTENEISPKNDYDKINTIQLEQILNEDDKIALKEITQEEDLPDLENEIIQNTERIKIILVEDDEEIRNYLTDHLSQKYNVFEAENGKIAWEILQNTEDIHLILSDLMMPVLDGIALCKMVKQNIQYCHIPFILLTAKNEVVHQLKGLQVGADDYIGKPFIYSILETKISNIFKQHQRIIKRYSTNPELNPIELVSNQLDEEFMSKAVKIVENYLDDSDFSVEIFSREMNMHRSGLHFKIKAITGESASDFIRKVRFSVACKLLIDGRYNVAEISTMIGMSPTYFSSTFKKHIGCLPREYVKNIRNKQD
jgi:signal transduction histidine kinase/ligand-binding sensor domain-containing protein/DNA-binding response OmpR family regulator